MKLTGNTIFVTGGGSGIGRALAEAFHRLGNQVIIAGRRKEHLVEVLEANSGMYSVQLDIENAASIAAAAKDAIATYPRLNVLINNAGVMHIDDVSKPVEEALLTSTITTNLMGPIRMTSALIDHLKKQNNGVVINVSSWLGFVPMAAAAVYSSTKAAMHSYTQSLRYKLRDTPVSVLEIIPPWVQTDLLNSKNEPRAMPLAEFINETMRAFETGGEEIMVERVKMLRDNAGPGEAAFVAKFNDMMTAS